MKLLSPYQAPFRIFIPLSLLSQRDLLPYGYDLSSLLLATMSVPQTFFNLDPLETDNRYGYVGGNPINRIDLTGLAYQHSTFNIRRSGLDSPNTDANCGISNSLPLQNGGSRLQVNQTKCQELISEVAGIIGGYYNQLSFSENPLYYVFDLINGATTDDGGAAQYSGIVLQLLAAYYSDIKLADEIFGITVWRPFPSPQINPGAERYGPINLQHDTINMWRNFYPEVDGTVEASWNSYGFRRPYFGNTHHLFLYLWMLKEYPKEIVLWHNRDREIGELQDILHYKQSPNVEEQMLYAFRYQEAVYDLYLTEDFAVEAEEWMEMWGPFSLPELLRNELCATSSGDVWALEDEANEYYFDLPRELWPDEEFWPES